MPARTRNRTEGRPIGTWILPALLGTVLACAPSGTSRAPTPNPGISPDGGVMACVPSTCSQVGANCGSLSDGCGGTLSCGNCASPNTCGGGALPNVCGNGQVAHYLYVLLDTSISVYDMDNGHSLVRTIAMPQSADGIHGVAASPANGTLYISHGSQDPNSPSGYLIAYDLVNDRVLYNQAYGSIDQMAVTPDGGTVYIATGEFSGGTQWMILNASTGAVTGSLQGGTGPHNTVVSLNGAHVYLGGRSDSYLYVADTTTNAVRAIGPLMQDIRPFTITGKETYAFSTHSGFLGFTVADIAKGVLLYTVPVQGFSIPGGFSYTTPSHGISLSPNEKEVWVIDTANNEVHVFDVTGLPGSSPVQIADIPISPFSDIGWIQHSLDGRFVYVGNSGDVIDALGHKVITNLPNLGATRYAIEIDWQSGRPIATSTRFGLGHVTQ